MLRGLRLVQSLILVTFSVFFVGWTERPTATIDGIGQIDPTAINNSSQIIGSHVVADHFTAVLLQENRSTDLDTTTDLGTPKEFISIATGINNKGVIVGTYNSRTADPTPHYNPRKICDVWGRNCKWIQMRGPPRYVSGPIFAFIRSDNVMRPLSEADSREVIPKSINDLGEVVGVVDSFPFIWRNGSLTVLERLPAHNYAIATAINNRDQIVGMANTAKSHDAWILENGFLTELEQLGGDFTSVYGINDAGIAVGESRTNANVRHAVIWRERKIVDLGSLAENGSSAAYGINNIGQVVGTTAVKNSNRFHAFVWQQGGMMDLEDRLPPDSGWELYVARSINDEGQIVGRGSYNGKFADFLMTLPR